MSKFYSTITCLLFIIYFILGCDSAPKKLTDLDRENLKGDVVLTETDREIIFYDSLHNKSMMIEPGELFIISKYNYLNKKLISIEQSAENFKSKNLFFYDKNGILKQSELSQYFKTPNGFKMADDVLKVYFYFDIDNNLILDSLNNNKGSDKYYYNDSKLDSSITTYASLNSSISYFENGNIVKSVEKNYTTGKIETYTFEYLLDPQGNWIQQISKINGKEDKVVNRKIFYKGQDISEYENKFNDLVAKIKNSNPSENSDKTVKSNSESTYIGLSSNSQSNSESNRSVSENSEKKCYKCNGSGKCSTCMKSFRVHYWGGSGGWKDANQTRPGQVMCNTCRGSGVIYGQYQVGTGREPDSKKCYVSACNGGWTYCTECNYGGNGKSLGDCKNCNGTGKSK